jgi:hypothetical protein
MSGIGTKRLLLERHLPAFERVQLGWLWAISLETLVFLRVRTRISNYDAYISLLNFPFVGS